MYRFCFLLLALLLPAPLLAQVDGPSTPPPTTNHVCVAYGGLTGPTRVNSTDTAATPLDPIQCLPTLFGGTGKGFDYKSVLAGASAGVTLWQFCPTKTTWNWAMGAWTFAEMSTMTGELPGVLSSADRLASAKLAIKKYPLPSAADPARLAIWCPHYGAMLAMKPPDPVFKVVKAPSNAVPIGTRAVFDFIRGVPPAANQFKATYARVAQYTVCSCTKEIWSTPTSDYCSVPVPAPSGTQVAIANPVALCSVQ